MKYALRDPRTPLAGSYATLTVAAPAPPPATFDPRASLPPHLNQVGGSCELMAFGDGPWIASGMRGERPSHLALYSMARDREKAYTTEPLPDNGTNDSDVMGTVVLTGDTENDKTVWGYVPGSLWPDTQENLFKDLPPDVYQAAVPITLADVRIITSSGAQLIADLQAAICMNNALQWPVKFSMSVDAAYENLAGATVYRGASGPSLGKHAQLLVGWAPDPADPYGIKFLDYNSWGDWADGGCGWLAGSFVVQHCSHFIAFLGGMR